VRRGRPHLVEAGLRWPPETFLCWKLQGLAARGFRITVVSKRHHVIDAGARVPGVRRVTVPTGAMTCGRRVLTVLRDGFVLALVAPHRLFRLVRALRRRMAPEERRDRGGMLALLAGYLRMARLRPDVVHYEWQDGAVRQLPMLDVWRCPLVISCHGLDVDVNPHVPALRAYTSRLPELMRRASAVHCVASALREQAVDVGLDPAKAWIIRAGLDPDEFRPAATARGEREALHVTMIGWLRWMKGTEYALEAVRRARDRGEAIELEVIGGPPGGGGGEASERERALHTIADLDLHDHVRLCGYVDSGEIARRLQATDVLIHPSVSEGLPTVLIEAMACGVPVVATDCGGVTEAVTDGVHGFVVPPRDPDALAEALVRLAGDPQLCADMGAAGRERVREEFTLDRQLDEFERMYRTVLSRDRPPPPPTAGPHERPRPPRPRGRRPRLLSAGPLIWEQGFEHSIHAVRLLLDMGIECQYRIITDAADHPAVFFARHQLGVEAHVDVVEAGSLADELLSADVFLDPAVADATPALCLQLARAAGVPSVATARAGLGDEVWLVPRRDPAAIAAAVTRLTVDSGSTALEPAR
jgi:colanic acid/amylovoran biosynthesis glycosyltransferase